MLRRERGPFIGALACLTFGALLGGCKPAPAPLVWETFTGVNGLFEAQIPESWGAMTSEGTPRVLAFATKAARGAANDPLLLQRNAMQEQSGLLVGFERVWRSAVADDIWTAYLAHRIELESVTHNQLTDRAVLEHTHRDHSATLLVYHRSFGSRAYYELVRFEERQGILLTARLFVPERDFLAHRQQLRLRLAALDWDEARVDARLPSAKMPRVVVPSI